MDLFNRNNEFDKDVIMKKLSELSSELEKEQSKDEKERSIERERELIYAQMIQGMKLNILRPNRNIFF